MKPPCLLVPDLKHKGRLSQKEPPGAAPLPLPDLVAQGAKGRRPGSQTPLARQPARVGAGMGSTREGARELNRAPGRGAAAKRARGRGAPGGPAPAGRERRRRARGAGGAGGRGLQPPAWSARRPLLEAGGRRAEAPRPRARPVPARWSSCWRGAATRCGGARAQAAGGAADGAQAAPRAGLAAERAGLVRGPRPPHRCAGSSHLLNKGLPLGKAARAFPAAGAGRGGAAGAGGAGAGAGCVRVRVRAGVRAPGAGAAGAPCACAGCCVRAGARGAGPGSGPRGPPRAMRRRLLCASARAPPPRPPARPRG